MVNFNNLSMLIILSLLFLPNHILAKELIELGLKSEIQILSDKAYRKTLDDSYEAHGNVIIKLKGDTIYGEKASVNLKEQRAEVFGNVRYVGSEYTLYATNILYRLDKKTLEASNAKLVNNSFTIVGKNISRLANGHFLSQDAEYSTCRDCPESWSVMGHEVEVVPSQYIYIKHGFMKINGVIIVYLPYIAFPIKTERQSGLLFPKFSFNSDTGFFFQQPVYYAMSEDQDMTFSPTFYGDRGQGLEWEYRKAINSKSNFSLYSLDSFDRIWAPGKTDDSKNESRQLRQYYELDLFYRPNNNFTLWADVDFLSDLDILGDYETYQYDRLVSNEKGAEINLQYRFSDAVISLDSSFMRNAFFENAKGFDHSYVQVLPRVSMEHLQWNLIDDRLFLQSVDFGQKLVFTKFKQNRTSSGSYERNVERFDYTPYLDIKYNFSNKVKTSQVVEFDYQYYILNSLASNDVAKKYGTRVTSSISFDMFKEFGEPYIVSHKINKIKTKENKNLINNIPIIDAGETVVDEIVSSYIHNINYSLNHSLYEKQQFSGNEEFLDNFSADINGARFDNRDSIRGTNNTLSEEATRKDIPESNSLELNMQNTLFRKTPRASYDPFKNFSSITSNYDLHRLAYFDVSQGYLLNTEEDTDFNDKLTRLFISTGFNLGYFSFNISEYYFHSSSEHITTLNFSQKLARFSYNLRYYYDSFSDDRRDFNYRIYFELNDLLAFHFEQDYDFNLNRFYSSTFKTTYNPQNNCWKFAVQYRERDVIRDGKKESEQTISFDFLLNYNSKAFTPAVNFEF